MSKKLILAALIASCVTLFAVAEDAKPAAAPKVAITLGELVSYETANGEVATYGPNGNNGNFSQTNLKGQVTFDLGSGLKLTPWAQERIDIKANDSSATALGLTFRTRFYAGLNTTLAIDPAFNLGLNLEYRAQADIAAKTSAAVAVVKSRFTPYLNVNGKIDIFYYSLTEDLPIYFDPTTGASSSKNPDNGQDNSCLELEGTYTLGLNFKLADGINLKTELYEYLDLFNLASNASADAGSANTLYSNTRLKLILVAGDIAPWIGGFMHYKQDNTASANLNNIVGGSIGADIKAGNATFNLLCDIGYDSAPGKGYLVSLCSVGLSLAY